MTAREPFQPALLAEVTRGPAVESRHFGHLVVVDGDGDVRLALGDPDRPTFPRSALKPLQALAAVARGIAEAFELTEPEIAVICASHAAEPRHLEAVASILRKIGATESDLHCGPHPVSYLPTRDALIRAGQEPTPIYSNCSGKHAGMLALARVLGAPLHGYWEPAHPVQQEIRRALQACCGVEPEALRWAVDGCGVPTYLLRLRDLARGFARLGSPERLPEPYAAAARQVLRAMTRFPGWVRGEGGFDTVLMESAAGIVAKGGAEGCEALALVDRRLGIAIKVEDGSPRPIPPVALAVLRRLEVLPEPFPPPLAELARPVVANTRGEPVGEVRACLSDGGAFARFVPSG